MTEAERAMAAKVLRAMGHPLRLGALECLQRGPMTVGALQRELGCSQSAMSQQVQKLEQHGLIATRRDGTQKFCFLRNPDVLRMMECLRGHLHRYLAGNGIGPSWNEAAEQGNGRA